MLKLHFTFSRRISAFGRRYAKTEQEKPKGGSKEDAVCASGSSSKSICLFQEDLMKKTCQPLDVDPEWEMREATAVQGPRVVVIGAGLAGLTAADRLVKAGINDVTILEADCRAGGRLRSRWAGDTVVELGLTGSKKKPLSWSHPMMATGPPVGSDPAVGLLHPDVPLPSIFRAYAALSDIAREESGRKPIPQFRAVRAEQMGRAISADEQNEMTRAMAIMATLMGSKFKVVEDSFCAYALVPGGSMIPLGETRALLPLLEKIGRDKVHYRKEAVLIRWGTVTPDQKPRAVVRCRDGSEYQAEYVIITSSLGYLKKNQESLFQPPLPQRKCSALQSAQVIMENKAFLVFQDPIWSWSTKPICFDLKPKPCDDPPPKDWTRGIVEMTQEVGSEKVVRVTVVGPEAIEMERLRNTVVQDALHGLLQKKLNIGSIPKPQKMIRSSWCDNRYWLGLRSRPGETADLAAPLPAPDYLPPVLLFAGEGTSPKYGLQGAVLSGLREADRLINIISATEGPAAKSICPKTFKN